jgi:peroxiredoxin
MSKRLQPGDPAPASALATPDGDEVSLESLRGGKVILYFYPAAMTPGCTTEACDFRDHLGSLCGAGYTVLGISPDDLEELARFREHEALTFPLPADPGHAVGEAYGAWGGEAARRQDGHRRDPFHLRPRRGGPGGEGDVRRPGDRARRRGAPDPRLGMTGGGTDTTGPAPAPTGSSIDARLTCGGAPR